MAKKGGGGPSNEIGELLISIRARMDALEQDFAVAKTRAAAAGKEIGKSVEAGADRPIKSLGAAFRALILPVTIGTSMVALTQKIVEASTEAFRLQQSVAGVTLEFSKLGGTQAMSNLSDFNAAIRRVNESAAAAKEQLRDLLLAEESFRSTAPGALWGRMWRGPMDELTAKIEEAMRRIEGEQSNMLKRAAEQMAKEMAKVLKEHLDKQRDQANKYLESIAIDSARHRQIAESMQASQSRGP